MDVRAFAGSVRACSSGRVAVAWYAVALLTAPVLMTATLLALSFTSPAFLPGIFTSDQKASILLIGLAVGLSAGVFEELGWTGFAIPTLRQRHRLLATGLIVGIRVLMVWVYEHTESVFLAMLMHASFTSSL